MAASWVRGVRLPAMTARTGSAIVRVMPSYLAPAADEPRRAVSASPSHPQLVEEARHAEEPVTAAVRRSIGRDRKVAGDNRLVGMLERDAVLVLEDDFARGHVDALQQPSDSHLAGERAESGRPRTRGIEDYSRRSVARSRQRYPLRALAGGRVAGSRDQEHCGERGGAEQREALLSLGASHASSRSRGRPWAQPLPAPSAAFPGGGAASSG